MNSRRNQEIAADKKCGLPKTETVDGLKNWLILMVCILWANLALESYHRFGIVKGPVEILFYLIDLVFQLRWLSCATLACYFLQIAQTFALEKLLSMDLISEKVGIVLHAINVFFLPTAFTVLARVTKAHPLVSRLIAVYILFVTSKVWSYVFVNSKFRQSSRQKITRNSQKREGEKSSLQYPHNVTVRNIITYMVFTPPVQYQTFYLRSKPDWKTFSKLFLRQPLVFFATAVIGFQFVVPELVILKAQEAEFKNTLRCALKIAVPVNLMWLLFAYVNTYKIYLPAYAALTGMSHVAFSKDWWNAQDMNMFWRRWNMPIHECLKLNVVFPLTQNGYSKTTAKLVAFAVAGILHEYANSLPQGVYNGFSFFCTLSEIPAGALSEYVAQKLGARWGNLLLWIYLFTLHSFGAVYYALILP